jgi:hypothetical protein
MADERDPAQYLHDLERYSVTILGNLNVRLFRDFSVNAFANYAWLRDQLYLSAAGASPSRSCSGSGSWRRAIATGTASASSTASARSSTTW